MALDSKGKKKRWGDVWPGQRGPKVRGLGLGLRMKLRKVLTRHQPILQTLFKWGSRRE